METLRYKKNVQKLECYINKMYIVLGVTTF